MRFKEHSYPHTLTYISESPVPHFECPLFEKTGLVRAAFSTRMGGVSTGMFSSMNFSSSKGDSRENVLENFRIFCRMLGTDYTKAVVCRQTHTTNVRIVTEEDAGRGIVREKDDRETDGLITNVPGITLVTYYADCIPLLFLDPVKKVIASSHSGWRGTCARMGKVTVEAMKENFGCSPEDILAAIGPGICSDCYEVGEELKTEFEKTWSTEDVGLIFHRSCSTPGKWQLDLWKANELILREAGIREDHLMVSNTCTCCNHEELFSHRASKGMRGNMAAFICLR